MTDGEFFFFMVMMDSRKAKPTPKYTFGEYMDALRSIFRPTPPNPWLVRENPKPVEVDELGVSHWKPPYN
jgi:hypothetical protein